MTVETNSEWLESYKWLNTVRSLSREEVFWLIQQAERAQQAEIAVMHWEKTSLDFAKENARLKKALEFYAEQDNYGIEISYLPQMTIDCMALDDGGHTARQALEGESE